MSNWDQSAHFKISDLNLYNQRLKFQNFQTKFIVVGQMKL